MFNRRAVLSIAAVLGSLSFGVLTTGCDWFSGSESSERSSPFISNLSVNPSSVLHVQTFNVSFRFDDLQGDIASARVTFQRIGTDDVREESPLWPENISRSMGAASFPFSFAAGTAGGVWSVKVQVLDDKDHISNTLNGEVKLNAAG